MKNNIFLLLTIFAYNIANADQSLDQQLQELKNNARVSKIPEIPVYDIKPAAYKKFGFVNYFLSTRLDDTSFTTQIMNDFPLNQVQMVGYMNDANVKYALIKTPYETLMLKVGDKIKSGVITSINESGAVIMDQQSNSSGSTYQKIINLKFDNNENVRLKLQ